MSSSDPTRVKSNYIPHILRLYGKSNAASKYRLVPVNHQKTLTFCILQCIEIAQIFNDRYSTCWSNLGKNSILNLQQDLDDLKISRHERESKH